MGLLPEAAERIQVRLDYLHEFGGDLVIDGDVHPTDRAALPADIASHVGSDPNYYHGRPLLSEEMFHKMDQAGVDMALCWQNPAVLPYTDDHEENARRLFIANANISALAKSHPKRVIPAGWTDPKALGIDAAITLARRCVEELAMPVVKMNPAQNQYPIDDPMVLAVVDAIVALGAIPAFHFGTDTPYTPLAGLKTVAERHGDHPVIAVHMGGGGGHFVEAEDTYQGARALGLTHPNIFYILSAKRDAHLISDLISYAHAGPPFSRNLAAASDAPYCDMIWNFGGFRTVLTQLKNGAGFGDPRLTSNPNLFNDITIRNFLGGNLARLISDADARILSRNKGRKLQDDIVLPARE